MKSFHLKLKYCRSHSTIYFATFALVFLLITSNSVVLANSNDEKQLVESARHTLEKFMEDPRLKWFKNNVKTSKALLIVPQMLKGAFFLGAEGGSGVLIVRNEDTNDWSEPAFYTVGGISFGFQWGGQASEVIVMARTHVAVEEFMSSSFKLGGDAAIAAGPYGLGVEGATSPNLGADFLSFSRSKGAFAGISFEGSILRISDDSNRAYYGKEVRPIEILLEKAVSNPHSAGLRKAAVKAIQ